MKRRQLEQHLRRLRDAREIMNAMKSLAFMETRRLAQRIEVQRSLLQGFEAAAADFLAFHPEFRPAAAPGSRVQLLFGSERGFCGNFNDRLLEALGEFDAPPASVIAIGRKLCSRLEGDPRLARALDGPSVLDEVGASLDRLSEALGDLPQAGLRLQVLYQDPETQQVQARTLLPPFLSLPAAGSNRACAPDLYLPPAQCFAELVDQYLFAALHAIAHASLMAENQRRLRHLDGAVRYLDDRVETLAQKGREIRQEEITEEIEVILLNVGLA